MSFEGRYSGRKAKKVLIVDDIPSNLELVEAVFVSEGFEVITAVHPRDAITAFETHQPDIAVVDVMMPEINGFQLCQILKDMAGKAYFPVVLLTALSDQTSRLKGIEAGADDFISKPFDKRELVAKARNLLKVKALYDELEHSENIILTLAVALEARDPYTKGHSTRVGELSEHFGRYIGLDEQTCEFLRKAGILHDIGKIGLSETLLLKPAPLAEEELEVIKQHPLIGEEICKPLQSLHQILPAIRHHHERWDGRGFPDGLKGKEIPLMARVLSIVDSYDAMLSERPYREGLSEKTVIRIMEEERDLGQWDPELLDVFIDMIKEGKTAEGHIVAPQPSSRISMED
ncbi:MAG: response regulator [Nitrospirae bacterium]|nr:MAG: response regulator [Nitrospirota bacterium]